MMLFGKVYIKCQTGKNTTNGFKVSGIYPFEQNLSSKVDYIAAAADFEQMDQNSLSTQTMPASFVVDSLVPGEFRRKCTRTFYY